MFDITPDNIINIENWNFLSIFNLAQNNKIKNTIRIISAILLDPSSPKKKWLFMIELGSKYAKDCENKNNNIKIKKLFFVIFFTRNTDIGIWHTC